LAKEVVIDDGEGAEDQQEFYDLLASYVDWYKPVGPTEKILVEKIATCIWRNKRALRYEVGAIRQNLDTLTDDYYDDKQKKRDDEIDRINYICCANIIEWQNNLERLENLHNEGKDLSEIYDWQDRYLWGAYEALILKGEERDEYTSNYMRRDYNKDILGQSPGPIRRFLNDQGYTDDQIWQDHFVLCETIRNVFLEQVFNQHIEKKRNKFRLSALKKSGSLPSPKELNNLIRYETSINRQMERDLKQLERLQRMRLGHRVLAQGDSETHGTPDIKFVQNESMS
jgi:hypothetical protein